ARSPSRTGPPWPSPRWPPRPAPGAFACIRFRLTRTRSASPPPGGGPPPPFPTSPAPTPPARDRAAPQPGSPVVRRPVTRHRAVLSVGSNLGDRLGTLQGCVHAIGRLPDTDVLARSPVYETAPVGGPVQPDYLNAVLIISTGLAPRALLTATQRVEAAF